MNTTSTTSTTTAAAPAPAVSSARPLQPATPVRLRALALAGVMTVAMLLAVNGLASSEPGAAQLAQQVPAASAQV